MSDILKSSFPVKNQVKDTSFDTENAEASAGQQLSEELKKRALASLGGSMVYVERKNLAWDGESDESK